MTTPQRPLEERVSEIILLVRDYLSTPIDKIELLPSEATEEIINMILSERQAADKLRQENEVLREEIKWATETGIQMRQEMNGLETTLKKYEQENEVLMAQVKKLTDNLAGNSIIIDQLYDECQMYMAQVSGLGGTLSEIRQICNREVREHGDAFLVDEIAEKSLSTLPSTFLELQKAKDAVISAAEYLVWPPKTESPSEVCPECGTYGYGELRDAFKALRTLQQAQDLAGQSKKEK